MSLHCPHLTIISSFFEPHQSRGNTSLQSKRVGKLCKAKLLIAERALGRYWYAKCCKVCQIPILQTFLLNDINCSNIAANTIHSTSLHGYKLKKNKDFRIISFHYSCYLLLYSHISAWEIHKKWPASSEKRIQPQNECAWKVLIADSKQRADYELVA